MAHNDEYNDEYQFTDLDVSPETMEEDTETTSQTYNRTAVETGNNIRRNALIVIVLILLGLLAYKFIGSFFTGKTKETEATPKTPSILPPPAKPQATTYQIQPQQQVPMQAEPKPQPITTLPTPSQSVVVQSSAETQQINQRLTALETSQQNLRSDVNSLNSQLGGINNNIRSLADKITALNQTISLLTAKLDRQSQEIAVLTEKTKHKVVHRIIKKRVIARHRPIFHIRAIIPGRAWLIAPNGSTLTVREGTAIVGYGIVKLIDPNQGRVLTSSGRVISFSQQDS